MAIFCQKCGQKASKYLKSCANCGTVLSVPNIPTYTRAAVAATIFLFLPTGLVALLYSLQINKKIQKGNIDAAIRYSKKALLFCWISFIFAILGLYFYISTQ